MMRLLVILTGFLVFYFIYGFYISQFESSVIPVELKPANPPGFYDYRGVINVRTSRSSGSSSPEEVASEAKLAGLDFLILTDTSRTENSTNFGRYHERLLVMDEREASFLDSRLLLATNNPVSLPAEPGEFNIFFTDILSQKRNLNSDQLIVLALPFNRGPTWTGPYPTGLDGIEVLNPKGLSQRAWQKSKLNVIWSFVTYPFNPRFSFLRLFSEPNEEIALWDKLSAERPTWGFAGSEANARAIPLANYLVKFPSYQATFDVLSNHVLLSTELTGSYEKDKAKLLSAFKRGQFYAALDILGDPKGFNAVVYDREKVHPMGSLLKLARGMRIFARLPIEPKDFYEIVLFKNGDREMVSNSQELNYEVKTPGTYRILVRVSPTLPLPDAKKWISWIYTNPFYIQP
jgi:hypothetical protein